MINNKTESADTAAAVDAELSARAALSSEKASA